MSRCKNPRNVHMLTLSSIIKMFKVKLVPTSIFRVMHCVFIHSLYENPKFK